MCKKTKHCLKMESLPHDVVERIISKQWKSTIESKFFQERQLKRRQESEDPDVLMGPVTQYPEDDSKPTVLIDSLRTLELGSLSSIKIPIPWENEFYIVSHCSCDGLVCLYYPSMSGFVFNPTTRWYRPLPLSNFQQLLIDFGENAYLELDHPLYKPGFGKDKFSGTYKPVWLYNSSELGLDNATICQVFDFNTNAWRFVTPSSPYWIIGDLDPVLVDGSLHWFTDCREETKVVSFDLHTEAFQVISKAPFANVEDGDIIMCNLHNRLCVSQMKWPNQAQVIWSFHSGNKTWHNLYSLDLTEISISYGIQIYCALLPLALFDGEKKKLLFAVPVSRRKLVIHDPETKSYDAAFNADSIGANCIGYAVCYLPSLISIL